MKAFEGGDSHSQRKQRGGNHDAVDKALYKVIAKYLGIRLLAGTGGKLVSRAATLFTSCSEYFSCSPLLCRSILISWICSRWLLSMLVMLSNAEDWLPLSFTGKSSDGGDKGIDEGFGAFRELWIHGSKSTIMILWFPTIISKSNFGLEKKLFNWFWTTWILI